MALMLIDTRRPPREPDPEPLQVNWRLCGWIALTLVLLLGAAEVPPLLGVPMAFSGLLTTAKILTVAVGGDARGLGEHRQ